MGRRPTHPRGSRTALWDLLWISLAVVVLVWLGSRTSLLLSISDWIGARSGGRLDVVLGLQREISLRKNRERIGKVEEILVEGAAKLRRGQMMGRTRTNRIVNIAESEGLSGKLAQVRITAASANSLLGELIATG